MRLRLTVRGYELLTLELNRQSPDELLAEAVAALPEAEDGQDMAGGSGGAFERDDNPRYPEADKDYETWIEKPFGGFGFGRAPR